MNGRTVRCFSRFAGLPSNAGEARSSPVRYRWPNPMKLLVLGGTVFLGRHIVEEALRRGHDVTMFNRGRHNPDLFPSVRRCRGDRDGGLNALSGERWDAVIDASGHLPRLVRESAEFLSVAVQHYTFISTLAVYAGFPKVPGLDEGASLVSPPDPGAEQINVHTMGPLKALCERAIESVLPGQVLTVRAGLLAGPHDPTDRFTYWPRRVAMGGQLLAPGTPSLPVQIIDARDLAGWILRAVEARRTGPYNRDRSRGPADDGGTARHVPAGDRQSRVLHVDRRPLPAVRRRETDDGPAPLDGGGTRCIDRRLPPCDRGRVSPSRPLAETGYGILSPGT